jgi:hypothetical protein
MPGIPHEDVEAAEFLAGPPEQVRHGRGIREVA